MSLFARLPLAVLSSAAEFARAAVGSGLGSCSPEQSVENNNIISALLKERSIR